MAECWLPVVGYVGIYEVSDQGRVRSLDRWVTRKPGRGGTRAFIPGVMMRLSPHHPKSPYPKVGLCKGGKQKTWAVHRLVLDAFVGPCPDGMEACHRNGDHTNSSLANLRWDTHRENWRDSARHGTAQVQAPATHCQQGHRFDDANTRIGYAEGRTRQHCRTCERARYEKTGRLRRDEYCRNGHAVTPENTRTNAKGYRVCVPCRAATRAREHAKRRQTRRAAKTAC